MTGDPDGLARDYRAAFLRYLPARSEAALATGYAIGRGVVESGTSVLDLARVHHEVLADLLVEDGADTRDVMAAAAEFLIEVLATVEMVRRSLHEPPDADPRPA